MGFLRAYLKQHRGTACLWAGFCAVFFILFTLYRLPPGAVLYGTALTGTAGVLVFTAGYLKFRKKYRLLLQAETYPRRDSKLPEPESFPEEQYQRMIRGLQEACGDLEDGFREKYSDLVDSYTIWTHQIKTPIAAIRLKLSGEDTEQSREIQEEILRIEQYVEMALAVLRLEGEDTDYVLQEYELDPILRQAVRRFSTQFIRRRIRLDYKPTEFRVLTDEKWLLFVVEQIISNALKYTKKGGTVTIAMDSPGILSIKDTGIGIAPEDLPRIFEKGYTGYNGRKDKKASGLGLYLCRKICENLGHGIRAESDPESGTVIRLDLRREKLETE